MIGDFRQAEHCSMTIPELSRSGGALREDLINVPICCEHGIEHAQNELVGDVDMEQVGHGIDEDHPRLGPAKRLIQSLGPKADGKGIGPVLFGVHNREPPEVDVAQPLLGKRGRVTVVATGAHLCAAGYWIPGGIGPFDAGAVAHINPGVGDVTVRKL
jgi:hypothetical protein